MPIDRLLTDMPGLSEDAVQRMTIDEILDRNEYLDLRLDAQEALRQAEDQHARTAARIDQENAAAANRGLSGPRASRAAMTPRKPGRR